MERFETPNTDRLVRLRRYYDRRLYDDPLVAEYYEGSGFFNFGYWTEGVRSQREACEKLMERLLLFIPEKRGTILDVACGHGATTRYLFRYYPRSCVTGISLSRTQIERSMANAPGATFVVMDATRLAFADSSFDSALCVEAAFHFQTRQDFLLEAQRVLKGGGRLVLSDILVSGTAARLNPRIGAFNHVRNVREYTERYWRAGFRDVEVVDATRECWTGFYNHLWRWRRKQLLAGRIRRHVYYKMCLRNLVANIGLRRYLLVAATKD